MHEMGYCQGVLEAVERRAAGREVVRLGVRIGAVHRVEPDAFGQSFRLLAAGGPAAHAATEVVVVPVAGHCLRCRTDFATADPAPACPGCGDLDVVVDGGDEIVLEWLEYAEADRPRGRPRAGRRRRSSRPRTPTAPLGGPRRPDGA